MSGSKAPDFDAYGLLRAMHSHNPTQYSHIVGLSSHFYAAHKLIIKRTQIHLHNTQTNFAKPTLKVTELCALVCVAFTNTQTGT